MNYIGFRVLFKYTHSLNILVFTIVVLSLISSGAFAKDAAAPPRADADSVRSDYKVGLVLSGGGAKGVAHIGVIKALEDNNIPIDYVAGTSAGAIVGSLYACGWNPEEMLNLFTSPDFKYWSTGVINPDHISYYDTPAPNPAWINVNLNFKDTTLNLANQILPSNLINPLPMNIEFLNLYAPYSKQCRENFNNLFVPLRTVCSDVYHKHKIVCRDGSLGDAVRASMSFPMVFKPIKMDGVLVYDGGIYDNFPVDVMEEDFNPDFIIGVSVSGPDHKPEPNNAYSQLEDMIIQNNNYTVPPDKGIKIQVPVLDFGVLEFDEARRIYEIGYRTGLSMVDSIRSRCPVRRQLSDVTACRESFKAATPDLEFDSISVTGTLPGQARYIKSLFYNGLKPHPIDLPEVENGYYRAVTGGKLNDLLPQYEMQKDNKNSLLLIASVKNPWKVGVGGWIASSTQSMLYLTFGFHTLSFNSLDLDLSGWIGQSYYAAMLKGRMALPMQTPSFLEAEMVVSRQKYFSSELLFYQDNTPTFITDSQSYMKLRYTRKAGLKGKYDFWIGGALITDKYFPDNVMNFADAEKDRSHYRTFGIGGDYVYSTLDNQLYPMAGKYINANVAFVNEGHRFTDGATGMQSQWGKAHPGFSAEFLWKQFFSLHNHFKLGTSLHSLVTFQGLYENYIATLVHAPGFAPTPSTKNYFNVAFRNDNFVAAGLIPIWNPVSNLQLRADLYGYSPIRDIIQVGENECRHDGWFRRVEFVGELAAVYNFPFASISIYGNYLTSPSRNWNFGISFGLFFQAPRFLR